MVTVTPYVGQAGQKTARARSLAYRELAVAPVVLAVRHGLRDAAGLRHAVVAHGAARAVRVVARREVDGHEEVLEPAAVREPDDPSQPSSSIGAVCFPRGDGTRRLHTVVAVDPERSLAAVDGFARDGVTRSRGGDPDADDPSWPSIAATW